MHDIKDAEQLDTAPEYNGHKVIITNDAWVLNLRIRSDEVRDVEKVEEWMAFPE